MTAPAAQVSEGTGPPPGPWKRTKPWLRRIGGGAITLVIFYYLLRPIVRDWPEVKAQVARIDLWRFVLAVAMFSALLLFRCGVWQRILRGLGRAVPLRPIIRIWSVSELSRYVPGTIWQVLSRVVMIRPYGVSGPICTTSQFLELSLFLLANVLVAAAALVWFAERIDEQARVWLLVAAGLAPVLAVVVHPAVYYRLANFVLKKAGRPPLAERLSGGAMLRLLASMIVALLWQGAAVFLLVQQALMLQPEEWWVVAAAYSLAWTAGFLAIWAPGGLGIRELVFVAAMGAVLPAEARAQLAEPAALLGFLAVMLRAWVTAGEILVCGLGYVVDHKGALGRADAPGRVES